jgi:hypothetical protein
VHSVASKGRGAQKHPPQNVISDGSNRIQEFYPPVLQIPIIMAISLEPQTQKIMDDDDDDDGYKQVICFSYWHVQQVLLF